MANPQAPNTFAGMLRTLRGYLVPPTGLQPE